MSSVDKSPAEPGQQQLWNAIRSALISARKGSPIDRVSRESALPLSFAQQRFWFMEQLAPDTFVNNLTIAFHLTGQLDVRVLEQSLGEMRRRHEILRTTFPLVDGKSTQAIDLDLTFTLPIVDLQELPALDRELEAQRQFTALAEQPFDLAQAPLLRVKLLRLAPTVHRTIVVMHHIICDGLSIEIFFQELAVIYTAFANHQPSPLVDQTIQYADFAVWQHQRLEGEILAFQVNYWKQQLGGILPILQLPIDRPRPPIQTTNGVFRRLELPQNLSTDLTALSQRAGVTLFMTCLAAFQTLLHRYSGQEDIIVGTPISGRNRTEIEGSIGCFINTLVLRTNLEHNPSFQELLRRVQQVALGAYAHQDLPFEKLLEELNPERDLSRSPLFQVMFIFERTHSLTWELPGVKVTPLEVHRKGISNFDLTLSLTETATGIQGGIEYNTDLFEPETIERMVGHFHTLLTGIVANPAQQIANLPLLTPAEQQQILIEWNQTQIDYPQVCIHQLFEAQVNRTPNAIAVICGDQQLTYQQLNHRANQLADRLHHMGITVDGLVGICLERSIEMVVGLLGILKAGGAYVPLDPHYPPARLSYMLTDAAVEILLTQSELGSFLPAHQLQVVCLDSDWQTFEDYSPENLDRGICPADLAYVLYTSGSTGQPKGVAIEHRNLVNFLNSMSHAPGIEAEATLTAVTTISFDIAALELYLPLIVGAKVIVLPREIAIDPDRLLDEVSQRLKPPLIMQSPPARTKIPCKFPKTLMQATPATWQMLLTAGWDDRYPLKVLCGGEALPDRLAQQMLATGSELWNLYGPTETTVWSTIYRVDASRAVANNSDAVVSIGRPIANTQIYILNNQLQPAPIGVPGEIYIGGAGLARGYLNRPELTAEKFIPNPFSTATSSRLYRTGDLARYSIDGNIEFLGRIDDLVKIRGFRIELGEIETALSQSSMVRQAVVIASTISPDNQSLIAYIVPHQNCTPTRTELCSFLSEKLPEYMMPAIFILLETLPLTANGKIDRRALPLPDRTNLEPTATFIAPKDGLELQLIKMWERVLKIQSIGTSDNFFHLEGHSLLAVQLFAEIKKTCGQNLPLATLFQSPTIEQLATILRQEPGSTTWSSLVPIATRGSKPPLFCAHPVGGNVLEYYPLAAHLGADQPIYGLQSPGLDGVQAPLNRIEDMAAHYIREIQSVQPRGPYFLAGYSFGALVAFEIACQLESQCEEIGLLALLDNASPRFANIRPPLVRSIGIHLQNLYQLEMSARIKYIKDRIIFRLMYQHKENRDKQFLIDNWAVSLSPEYLKVLDANFQAAQNYTGQFYRGQVTLFRSSVQLLERSSHPDLGWDELVGSLKIYNLPGHHSNLLKEPSIQILAEKLKLCLESSADVRQIPTNTTIKKAADSGQSFRANQQQD
jgi:amino acid adenylation domain-containing protein